MTDYDSRYDRREPLDGWDDERHERGSPMIQSPQWAALKIHDETHQGASGLAAMVVPVATKVFGPYATERAAVMVARGMNVEAYGTADRFIPVRVELVNGWTWDGQDAPIQVGGSSLDCVSQPGPGQVQPVTVDD